MRGQAKIVEKKGESREGGFHKKKVKTALKVKEYEHP